MSNPSPPSSTTRDHSRTGGCACGAIGFSYAGLLGGALGAVTLCQCALCRRLHGIGAAVAPARAAGFVLLRGEAALREFESSPGKFRAFCGLCGTPLYSRRAAAPGALRLRIGCLDHVPESLRIEALIHTRDRPAWCELTPAPAHYPESEPGRPGAT